MKPISAALALLVCVALPAQAQNLPQAGAPIIATPVAVPASAMMTGAATSASVTAPVETPAAPAAQAATEAVPVQSMLPAAAPATAPAPATAAVPTPAAVQAAPAAAAAEAPAASEVPASNAPRMTAGMPRLSSHSVLVINEANGAPLLEKNPDMQTPIASISKLMTAMVVLDAKQDPTEKIEVTEADVDTLRHSASRLAVGTVLTRDQMLHLALIASENRAASALSRNYPGGRVQFIRAMNRKAAQLGMTHTSFEDPTGLSSHNRSTAEDLAKMVKAAASYPLIHRITTTGEYDIRRTASVEVHRRHRHAAARHLVTREIAFHNTNQLVRENRWDIGLSKTGFINEAGHCLVMQVRIASRPVIIVLLDAYGKFDRISDARRIHQWLEAHSSVFGKEARRARAGNRLASNP